jgi:hypothetical protein
MLLLYFVRPSPSKYTVDKVQYKPRYKKVYIMLGGKVAGKHLEEIQTGNFYKCLP